MILRVLGPIELWRGGTRVELRGSKLSTVLAALMLANDHVLSDQSLVELLWGENPPATAQAQIQTYASRLRGILGDEVRIARHRHGYRLAVTRGDLDLTEFERLTAEGRAALASRRAEEAADKLTSALAFWHGEALTGATEFLTDLERPRLEEARLAALEDRVEAYFALGRHIDMIPELMALVTAHPMRERPISQLMLALYRCGRSADALAAYQEYRHTLAEELGIDPSSTLRDLHQAILVDRPTLLAPSARRPPVAHLPPDPPDFTGRAEAVGRALRLLIPTDGTASPVCAITGMAGVGKSAFALHLAHRLREHYPDGQIHLSLRGSGAQSVPPAKALVRMLRVLGDTDPGAPNGLDDLTRRYREQLSGRRVLIILDDAAHERQIRPLLPGTAGSGIVVTSRNRLAALDGSERLPLDVLDPRDA
jgi:DNA-binding SARP family transcriptional activator